MATKGASEFRAGGENYTINDPNIANEFAADTAYSAGQPVYYQGNLYYFTTDHAAGAWNSAHVRQVKLGQELSDVKSALDTEKNGTINIESSEIISGEWGAGGSVVANTKRLRTNNLIPVCIGQVVVFETGTKIDMVKLGKLSPTKQYQSDTSWFTGDTEITVDWNGYMVIGFRNSLIIDLSTSDYDATTKYLTITQNEIDKIKTDTENNADCIGIINKKVFADTIIKEGKFINSSGAEDTSSDYKIIEFYINSSTVSISISSLPSDNHTIRLGVYDNEDNLIEMLVDSVYTTSANISKTYEKYYCVKFKLSLWNTGVVEIANTDESGINNKVNSPYFNLYHTNGDIHYKVIESYSIDASGVESSNPNYDLYIFEPINDKYTLNVQTGDSFITLRWAFYDANGNATVDSISPAKNYSFTKELIIPDDTKTVKVMRGKSASISISGLGFSGYEIANDLLDSDKWQGQFSIGGISSGSGADVSASHRIRTDFIKNVRKIYFDKSMKFVVLCYGQTKNYLGVVESDLIAANRVLNHSEFKSNTVYIRICGGKLDNSDYSESDVESAVQYIDVIYGISDTFDDIKQYNDLNKPFLIDSYLNKGRMEFAAHRGARLDAPENSLPAFELAGQQGFDWLNLAQLRQSKDGTWYVMHDSSIDRTTDGTGNIKDLTDEYLATVHIDYQPSGVHYDISDFTEEQLVIPTLEDAIKIARKYGMKIYFRIASLTKNNYNYNAAERNGWNSLIAIVRKYRCEGMLFGADYLEWLLPLHRDLGLDWCINYDVYSAQAVSDQISAYEAAGIKNATIYTTDQYLTDELIASARSKGYKVMVSLTSDRHHRVICEPAPWREQLKVLTLVSSVKLKRGADNVPKDRTVHSFSSFILAQQYNSNKGNCRGSPAPRLAVALIRPSSSALRCAL